MSVPQYVTHLADTADDAVLTRGLVKQYGGFRVVNGLNLKDRKSVV